VATREATTTDRRPGLPRPAGTPWRTPATAPMTRAIGNRKGIHLLL